MVITNACVARSPCQEHARRNSPLTIHEMFGMDEAQLRDVDPVEMDLAVAKGVWQLRGLDVRRYQGVVDEWANELQEFLHRAEPDFYQNAEHWKNDIHFFRLGGLCYFVVCKLQIRYIDQQREAECILYNNPSDLFMNGVIDTRQGTCGNMATLHLALAWRLGWPVTLACAGNHLYCKFDNGAVRHNIETTNNSERGFQSHPDEYYREIYRLPRIAAECGSDLRALTPREVFGIFFKHRARHRVDVGELVGAERDLLLARNLFPANRMANRMLLGVMAQLNRDRFAPDEAGHPATWRSAQYESGSPPNRTEPGQASC